MRNFILIFVLLISSLSAFASEWVNIGQDLFLDKASVRYCSKSRTYKAWVKEIKPKEIILTLNEYNIKEHEWRNIDTVTMDLQNKVKKREYGNIGMTWLNVVPESNSALEYEAVKKEAYKIELPKNEKKDLE